MKKDQFDNLKIGDIVRHKIANEKSFIVTANYGGRATAVQSVDLTNRHEWDIMFKSSHELCREK